MAEKMTPNGLVVGLIIEPDEVQEAPVTEESEADVETPETDKPKRDRKAKAE